LIETKLYGAENRNIVFLAKKSKLASQWLSSNNSKKMLLKRKSGLNQLTKIIQTS
jgi:hypothetical protein